MTPEQKAAHKKAIEEKQTTARAAFSDQEREIFEFMKSRWDAMGDNYDPDKHDAPVIQEAAEKFGVPPEEAARIFEEVDGAGLDL